MYGKIKIVKICNFFDSQQKMNKNRIDYILYGEQDFKAFENYIGRETLNTITNKNIINDIPKNIIEKEKIVDCEFTFDSKQFLLKRIYINEKPINLL